MQISGGKKSTIGLRDLDLDAIRGLANLLAMGWHLNHPPTNQPILDAILTPGRRFGWAGVDLFFVLSGFLVGGIVLREAASGKFQAGRFMGRRILKLWPVLYLYLTVELVIGQHPWKSYLLQDLFHVQNFTGTSLDQLWSLAVEEHFYLAVVLFYPAFVRRQGKPATLVKVLVGIMLLAPALRTTAVLLNVNPVEIAWQSQYRADALACGVLLAVVSVHYPALYARLLGLRLIWLTTLVGGIIWLCLVPQLSILMATVGYTITYLTGLSLILLMRKSTIVRRFPLAFRPLGVLGIYSYCLYIWHPAAAQVGATLAERAGIAGSPTLLLLARYGTSLLAAVCITRAVEWPFLRFRDRIFPRAGRSAPPAEAVMQVPVQPDLSHDIFVIPADTPNVDVGSSVKPSASVSRAAESSNANGRNRG